MTFSNPLFFLAFLPICLAGFAILGRFGRRSAVGFLAIMSLIFYAQWSRVYLLLLIASILFNFAISHVIVRNSGRETRQTIWLVFGIASNLLVLCYCKYLFPFLHFLMTTGLSGHNWGSLILPLGISFFTFTQIAYLVDVKQRVAETEGLLSYVLFVTFFPHLIAGPILHHREIMPQFREERRYGLDSGDVALGLTWFSMGLFKKLMIADHIAPFANELFKNPQDFGVWATWTGVLAYAMQLYFDFSGYSDMAVGIARMFSIRFPLNFNSPYKAQSIIDFWQRWHITLTRYIMNYVYSPVLFWISRRRLEQGKKSSKRVQATFEGFTNLIALPMLFTLFLAGVWHGAGLQFMLYGLMHGTYLTVNHAWRTFVPTEHPLRTNMRGPVAVAVTFFFVLLGEVMFRANGVHGALTVYMGLFGFRGIGQHAPLAPSIRVLILLAIIWLLPNTQELLGEQQREDDSNWSVFRPRKWAPTLLWWAAMSGTFLLSMAYSTADSTFLYFQF